MNNAYIVNWDDGNFSLETEPPGAGSKLTTEGPFPMDECRKILKDRGLVEDGNSCWFTQVK